MCGGVDTGGEEVHASIMPFAGWMLKADQV